MSAPTHPSGGPDIGCQAILAFETSCDDTSVAVVSLEGRVLAMASANQDADHAPFGGIVPEIASRNHTQHILPLVDRALKEGGLSRAQIAAIAVTSRPGLIGSLMVGVVTAKALALAWNKPIIAVNHLHGHIHAFGVTDESYQAPAAFNNSYLALVVSGGHSAFYQVREFGHYQLLGQTLDDAAGEAFDKFAKMLGLGYPGGAEVDRWAKLGDPTRYRFPRALSRQDNLNLSFSGLKASAQRELARLAPEERQKDLPHLCASFQEAVVESLMLKLEAARTQRELAHVVITGGVSANSRLRQLAQEWGARHGVQVVIPPLRYCTDNAAMIGWVGAQKFLAHNFADQGLTPSARSLAEDFAEAPLAASGTAQQESRAKPT